LCIVQDSAIQDWPPFSSLESDLQSEGNPLRARRDTTVTICAMAAT
jgi:hypothetical protein